MNIKKFMQVGAAGVLSLGVLAACGDDGEEMDPAEPGMEEEEAPMDENTDDGMDDGMEEDTGDDMEDGMDDTGDDMEEDTDGMEDDMEEEDTE